MPRAQKITPPHLRGGDLVPDDRTPERSYARGRRGIGSADCAHRDDAGRAVQRSVECDRRAAPGPCGQSRGRSHTGDVPGETVARASPSHGRNRAPPRNGGDLLGGALASSDVWPSEEAARRLRGCDPVVPTRDRDMPPMFGRLSVLVHERVHDLELHPFAQRQGPPHAEFGDELG